MSAWRPIGTAPKDGSALLITDGENIEVCEWECNPYLEDGGRWQGTYYDGYGFTYNNGEPTHWMPLPELPNTGKQR